MNFALCILAIVRKKLHPAQRERHQADLSTIAPLAIAFCFFSILTRVPLASASPNDSDQKKVGTTAAGFLTVARSPRALGMGNCVVNLVSEESPLYNPGALGVFHLRKNLAITYPLTTKLPWDWSNDLRLRSLNVSAGASIPGTALGLDEHVRLGAALAYSQVELYSEKPLEVTSYEYPLGDTAETFDLRDVADYYSAAVAIEYYYLKIGVGYTYKAVEESYKRTKVEGDLNDYGVIIEFPLGDLLSPPMPESASAGSRLSFAVTPSFAYVKASAGHDMRFPGIEQAYHPPRVGRFGFSLYCAARIGDATLGSLRIAREVENDLVEDDSDFKKVGGELGLSGIFYMREGYIEDSPYFGEDLYTFGFGLSAGGAISWLKARDILHTRENMIGRAMNNLV